MLKSNDAPVPNLHLNSPALEKVLKLVHTRAKPLFSNGADITRYESEGFAMTFRGEAPETDKHTVTFKGHGVSLCLGWKESGKVEVRHTTVPGLPPGVMTSDHFIESLFHPQLRGLLVKLVTAAYGKPATAEV